MRGDFFIHPCTVGALVGLLVIILLFARLRVLKRNNDILSREIRKYEQNSAPKQSVALRFTHDNASEIKSAYQILFDLLTRCEANGTSFEDLDLKILLEKKAEDGIMSPFMASTIQIVNLKNLKEDLKLGYPFFETRIKSLIPKI